MAHKYDIETRRDGQWQFARRMGDGQRRQAIDAANDLASRPNTEGVRVLKTRAGQQPKVIHQRDASVVARGGGWRQSGRVMLVLVGSGFFAFAVAIGATQGGAIDPSRVPLILVVAFIVSALLSSALLFGSGLAHMLTVPGGVVAMDMRRPSAGEQRRAKAAAREAVAAADGGRAPPGDAGGKAAAATSEDTAPAKPAPMAAEQLKAALDDPGTEQARAPGPPSLMLLAFSAARRACDEKATTAERSSHAVLERLVRNAVRRRDVAMLASGETAWVVTLDSVDEALDLAQAVVMESSSLATEHQDRSLEMRAAVVVSEDIDTTGAAAGEAMAGTEILEGLIQWAGPGQVVMTDQAAMARMGQHLRLVPGGRPSLLGFASAKPLHYLAFQSDNADDGDADEAKG